MPERATRKGHMRYVRSASLAGFILLTGADVGAQQDRRSLILQGTDTSAQGFLGRLSRVGGDP